MQKRIYPKKIISEKGYICIHNDCDILIRKFVGMMSH